MTRRSLFHKPLWLLLIATFSTNTQAFSAVQAPPAREKIASGEYKGEFNGQGWMTEKWTMWRIREGNLEIESTIRVFENNLEVNSTSSLILLTPELHPVKATLSLVPPGKDAIGDLIFEFHKKLFQVKGRKRAKLKIESPYDLFMPTPWFLASIVRRAKLKTGRTTKVKLIFMEGESNNPRIALMPFEGMVKYLGPEVLTSGKSQVDTHKYELDPKALPWKLLVWIAEEGIVMAYEDSRSGQRVTLQNYEKYADFLH